MMRDVKCWELLGFSHTYQMRTQIRMPDHSRMKLGIILLNWNAEELTTRCVRVLQEWRRLMPNIYVIDNGSIVKEFNFKEDGDVPVFLIQSPTNRGFAGGNNLGIHRALEDGCDYILLLNNDASISERDIEMLLDHLWKDTDIGCIGPCIHEGNFVYLGGRDIGIYPNTRNTTIQGNLLDDVSIVDYVPGAVFLARREVFERVGLLDEDFFFSGEIADLCTRAEKKGYKCGICPEIIATHVLVTDNPLRSTLYAYYSLRNRFLYIRKHHSCVRWILEPFWVLWGIYMCAWTFKMGMRKESAAYRLAILDGLKGIFGDRNDLFSV